jgi:bacteriocin-like protein
MQNVEQKNSEIETLSDAELEAINGGFFLWDAARWIIRRFQGPGDLRPPTRQP